MKIFILFFAFFFGLQTFAQSVTETPGDIFPGIYSVRNLVKNPNCRRGTADITAASVSMTANTTSGPLNGLSDCKWDPTATAQEISWAVNTFPTGVKNGNCEARLVYSGDASLVSFFVRNSSGPVANGVSLTNADNSKAEASIVYPCSSGTAVPVLRSTGNAASVQYAVYAGNVVSVYSANVNSQYTSYSSTAGLSGLGTGSATVNYAEWARVGPNIFIRFRITKDGSGGSGSTAVAISVPSGITISSRITQNYFGGSAGSGITTNGSFELYYDTLANNIKFLQNDSTTLIGSEFTAGAAISGFISFPVNGWEGSSIIADQTRQYYPTYDATIVADASFSLASDVTQNGNWIASGSRDTQATYTMTFTSGTFTATPICKVSVRRNLANTRYTVSAWITSVSSSSVTFAWAANDDQGASVAAAIAVIDDSGTFDLNCTSTTPSSLPVPVLLGSVTSTNTTNALRLESAYLNCSSSSSITRQSATGSFISTIGNVASGACAITFATAFAVAPMCVVSGDSQNDPDRFIVTKALATTGVTIDCDVSGGSDCTNYDFNLICVGLK